VFVTRYAIAQDFKFVSVVAYCRSTVGVLVDRQLLSFCGGCNAACRRAAVCAADGNA
jgi:hypothetical protein